MLGSFGFVGYRIVDDVSSADSPPAAGRARARGRARSRLGSAAGDPLRRSRANGSSKAIPERLARRIDRRGDPVGRQPGCRVPRPASSSRSSSCCTGPRSSTAALAQITRSDAARARRTRDAARPRTRASATRACKLLGVARRRRARVRDRARRRRARSGRARGVGRAVALDPDRRRVHRCAADRRVRGRARRRRRRSFVARWRSSRSVVGEWFVNRWLERRTLRRRARSSSCSPRSRGLELYGFTGALLCVLGVILLVAIVARGRRRRGRRGAEAPQPA